MGLPKWGQAEAGFHLFFNLASYRAGQSMNPGTAASPLQRQITFEEYEAEWTKRDI